MFFVREAHRACMTRLTKAVGSCLYRAANKIPGVFIASLREGGSFAVPCWGVRAQGAR